MPFSQDYHNRGLVYRNKQDFDHAVAAFNEAIRLNAASSPSADAVRPAAIRTT
jgi:hypothetical protein